MCQACETMWRALRAPAPERRSATIGGRGLRSPVRPVTLVAVLAQSTPDGSRLGDDLYSLYLAGLAWLLLPIYSSIVAVALPSDLGHFDRVVDLAVAVIVVAPLWFGYRGGPILVNRAVVLHELGAPSGRRAVLVPRLARQAVAYGAVAALAADALTVMGGGFSTSPYRLVARDSFVAGVATFAAVALTVGWLVVWKTEPADPEALRPTVRRSIGAINLAASAAVVAVVVSGRSLTSSIGVAALLAGAVLGVATAWVAAGSVPIHHLWRRATALEGMRSAAQSFDFQRVLVSLRRAVDQTEARRSRFPLSRRWMPRGLWRYLAGFERGWNTRLGQLVVGAVAAGVVATAGPSNGLVALAISAAGMVVGLELASPVAAAAGQSSFTVHYPRGSAPVLRSHLVTAVVAAAVLAGLAVGWLALGDSPTAALAGGGLFVFGTLAAAVQGRLGSPDLLWLTEHLGTFVAQALWVRALLGPLLSLGLTIVVFHGWLRPDGHGGWPAAAAAIVIAALVVAGYPLERMLP